MEPVNLHNYFLPENISRSNWKNLSRDQLQWLLASCCQAMTPAFFEILDFIMDEYGRQKITK